MPRVLHIHSELGWGGVETWLMGVVRRLDPAAFQFDFLVNSARPDYQELVRSAGGNVLSAPPVSNPLRFLRRLNDVLRSHGPYDAVHSHFADHNGIVMRAASRAGVPIRIAHSHLDIRPVLSRASWPRRAYIRWNQHWIQQYATQGLATSGNAAASLFGENWRNDPRWRVLPCGIEADDFGRAEAGEIRSQLGIPPDAFVVGHIGRFHPQKNHAMLPAIIAATLARRPSARFLLIGDGPLKPAFEQDIARRGLSAAVTLVEKTSSVPHFLKAMNAFVFPSLYEGLGMVVVEAQAAGVPAVIADTLPAEVDVVPPLVRRLKLSQSPQEWSDALLAFERNGPGIQHEAAWELVRQSQLNIENSVRAVTRSYQPLCPQPEFTH